MTLRLKTMLILVATVVISLGGSGLFFLQHFEQAFRASVSASLDSIAHENANRLADYLQLQHRIISHIGMLLPTGALELEDYQWVEAYLKNNSRDFSFFADGFFVLDEKGLLRAEFPVHAELFGNDYSQRPYFQQTMADRQGLISAPYRFAETGQAVLTFTVYLTSAQNTPLGLLAGSVSLLTDPDLNEIRNRRIGETGYLYVFDKSRLMILHPDENRMLTRDVPVGVNQMFDAAIDGFAGVAETVNSKGVAMYVAFHPVPDTDWIVAAQQPVAEALQPLVASRQPLILLIVFGSIVAAMLGMLMVHRSMRGLLKLEAVTAQLAIPDEHNQQIEAALQVETEKLAEFTGHREFGALAVTIRELYSRLGLALASTRSLAKQLEATNQQLKASQSQILHQEKMASIGQLAAGVAHEINNPMGFVTSNLNSLGRHQEKLCSYQKRLEDWLKQLGDVEILAQMRAERKRLKIEYLQQDISDLLVESTDGVERVRQIVQNLKSFSRVDQTEYCASDIHECLESTLAIAWNEIKYKATVEKDFGQLPPVPCYPQQLNQVFLNILVNAAQAIEEKGAIRIRTWQQGDWAKIAISDNGAGIPEAIRHRIFEPFFTTKAVGKGTGLGMSISYEIIKKHQGDIKIESSAGQGTTFTIELPLQREGTYNG